MRDLSAVPREYLSCRAFAHVWDHGPAPIQRDRTQVPEVWVAKARCTSCAMKRQRWLVPSTCEPFTDWAYEPPVDYTLHMHLVTQLEARGELARRDGVGTRRQQRKAG